MFHDEKKLHFAQLLTSLLGTSVTVSDMALQGGGCINKAAILHTSVGKLFVKWNYASLRQMFEVEVKGLELLRGTGAFSIPKVIGHIDHHDESFLFLEMVEPQTIRSDFYENFGARLAALHRTTAATFGLDHDNFIGSLPQKNTPFSSWADFFIQCRIEPQLQMAFDVHRLDRAILHHAERFYRRVPELFPQESPALLHGDLWSGNILKGADGCVCLIDPAVYYGHREMELAYTQLFDQLPDVFYASYHDAFPLVQGFDKRVPLYQLYPLMVHVNLFGGGYIQQVQRLLQPF